MILQHPESLGQDPQLFQTFTVHTCPITKVMLSAKHLISGRSNSQVYFLGKYSNIPGKPGKVNAWFSFQVIQFEALIMIISAFFSLTGSRITRIRYFSKLEYIRERLTLHVIQLYAFICKDS